MKPQALKSELQTPIKAILD